MLPAMQMSLTILAVIAANILGSVMAIPQAARLVRLRRTDGVSPAWAAMSITINSWWAIYGFGVDDWAIVPGSLVSVAAYVVIAGALVRLSDESVRYVMGRMLGVVVLGSAIPVAAIVLGSWAVAGVTLGALYAVQLSPAVAGVYRSADVSGVSTLTWLIAFAEAALWGLYGVPHRDAGLIALFATGAVMSSLVLVRLFLRRTRLLPYGPVRFAALG